VLDQCPVLYTQRNFSSCLPCMPEAVASFHTRTPSLRLTSCSRPHGTDILVYSFFTHALPLHCFAKRWAHTSICICAHSLPGPPWLSLAIGPSQLRACTKKSITGPPSPTSGVRGDVQRAGAAEPEEVPLLRLENTTAATMALAASTLQMTPYLQ
jgi:hypothetical protein